MSIVSCVLSSLIPFSMSEFQYRTYLRKCVRLRTWVSGGASAHPPLCESSSTRWCQGKKNNEVCVDELFLADPCCGSCRPKQAGAKFGAVPVLTVEVLYTFFLVFVRDQIFAQFAQFFSSVPSAKSFLKFDKALSMLALSAAFLAKAS